MRSGHPRHPRAPVVLTGCRVDGGAGARSRGSRSGRRQKAGAAVSMMPRLLLLCALLLAWAPRASDGAVSFNLIGTPVARELR